ncbi:MAG: maleylacetate reductase [Thermoleophilaceae bacterium]|nr:maleylacetate reductase [Thermoleophilaceae bacterium]
MADAPALLSAHGLDAYALLTTDRALAQAPDLARGAEAVVYVPEGWVDEVSAKVRPQVGGRAIVALGGGRVVDTAKAIAGADGTPVAAVATTLSGAEMTRFHRSPAGAENARLVRPSLVVADSSLMASQPMPGIAASALNALAHAVEALYAPLANPVASMAALRGAHLIAGGLSGDEPVRRDLALGALLAGYASGQTGYAFHHVLCQTTVRLAGTPHAETNAVVLPHSVRFMTDRAPGEISRLARTLGDADAAATVARLTEKTGVTTLRELGVVEGQVDEIVAAAAGRAEVRNTPRPPGPGELRALMLQALG